MSIVLIVLGTLAQIAGVGYVIYELHVIRSFELGEAVRWGRQPGWLRRLLLGSWEPPRPGATDTLGTTDSAIRPVSPGPALPGRPETERIARLEAVVEQQHAELTTLRGEIARTEEDVIEAAREAAREVHREHHEREELKRQWLLRPSVRRQRRGAVLIVIGLLMVMFGSII